MSDAQQPFGFGALLPGMDFLKQLTQAGQASAPGPLSHWMSPSLSAQDIDKRIEELKAVQFWLEQNSRALTATVQALQVQKMTLSTLQSMNVNLGELAKAFPWAGAAMTGATGADAAPAAAPAASAATPSPAASPLAGWPMSAAQVPSAGAEAVQVQPTHAPAPAPAPEPPCASAATPDPAPVQAAAAAGSAQAVQWWGALTQQFQQIAAQALQDPMQQAALQQASSMATQWTQAAAKTASEVLQSSQTASQAMGAEHTGAGASVGGAAIAPKAASTGKPAGKTASKPAAKTVSAPSVRATTTAARKSTTGPAVGDGQGVAPVRPKRSAAARKNGD